MSRADDEEHQMWRESVRAVLTDKVTREYIRRTDLEHEPPWDAWELIADQGWLGLLAPEDLGGMGGDIFHVAILLEELGRRSQDLAVMAFRTILHCNMKLQWHGTRAQQEFYIPRAVKGEIKFALAVSEPDTGNDAASISTRAERNGDGWTLNGHKMWTTGFQLSDYVVVVARTSTDPEKRHAGLTNFIVDSHADGFSHRVIPTLGRWPIPTCEVWLDNVSVPSDAVVGEVDGGWTGLLTHLGAERFCTSSMWLGEAEAAFEDALAYAKQREQFGQSIGKFQAIAHKLADMRIKLEAARLLLYSVGDSVQEGKPDRVRGAAMKCFVSDTFKQVALDALQITGGFGYSMEMDIQRYVRDGVLAPIGPGSNEIQRNIIAKELGL
jgi:acyl-CoA dehydrogenase